MKTTILTAAALGFQLGLSAAVLDQGRFTEVIKDVNRLSTEGKATPAHVEDVVQAPERVRTGDSSRAELTAPDKTITRIGARTVFSFDRASRTLNLEQGSVLFHAPKGVGGGKIRSGGASAAVLGTTIIVSATESGGFKLVVLEGKGKATLANGKAVVLKAGQLVFVLPGGQGFSEVLTIHLGKLAANSLLVNGFSHPLPSVELINASIRQQNLLIYRGKALDTGLLVDNFNPGPGNGLQVIDPATYQVAVHPPLTPAQVFGIIQADRKGGGPGGSALSAVTGRGLGSPINNLTQPVAATSPVVIDTSGSTPVAASTTPVTQTTIPVTQIPPVATTVIPVQGQQGNIPGTVVGRP
jgi:hypothetical protein